MRPSISPLPISTPWKSRCAICIVRSAENPSLRFASCCSVDVVNGARGPLGGRLLVDRRDAPRQPAAEHVGQSRVASCLVAAGARCAPVSAPVVGVEVLARRDALVADPHQRGDERPLAPLADRRLEVPVGARAEPPALFLALDDQPDGHALHAAGAEPGLHLLPEHRRQRVAVEPVEDAAGFLRAHQGLVDAVRAARAPP